MPSLSLLLLHFMAALVTSFTALSMATDITGRFTCRGCSNRVRSCGPLRCRVRGGSVVAVERGLVLRVAMEVADPFTI